MADQTNKSSSSSSSDIPHPRPRRSLRHSRPSGPTPTPPAAPTPTPAPPPLPLVTARVNLPTRMPERDGEWLASVRDVSDQAKRHTTDVQAKWEACVSKFWALAKARMAEAEGGAAPEREGGAAGNRDVRDFCAVATRVFDPHLLDLSLSVAYAHMPAKIERLDKKLLKASIDAARRAIETSLRAPGGANKHQDFSKWRLFWWFGEEISTNVSALKTLSATLNPSKRTRRVSFDELTNLLWRKVFAKRGDSETFPSPTVKDLSEVVQELVEAKIRADELEHQQQVETMARREAIDRQKEELRGQKRRLDDHDDVLGDEDLYNASPRREGKRQRRSDEGLAIAAADQSSTFFDISLGSGSADRDEPSPENGRGGGLGRVSGGSAAAAADVDNSIRELDEMAEEIRHAPRSVDSIRAWLARARRADRDLAPPDDPDEIVDDDVRDALRAARISLGLAMRMMDRAVARHG